MIRFLMARIGHAALTLIVLAGLVFVLSRAVGDPTTLLVPIDATPEQVQRIRSNLGLDRSYGEQLVLYARDLLQADLGTSYRSSRPVLELIGDRLPTTLGLASVAMGAAILLAFPLGVLAAVRRGTRLDEIVQVVGVVGFAMPTFWLGLILIQVVAVGLGLLPVAGFGWGRQLILPAMTLGLAVNATLMRLLRSSLLEVLGADFMRTATSKGLSSTRVIWVHGVRNALIPVLTYGGVIFTQLITGAVVVEVVFAWPGLGRLVINAISTRDYPVIQGVVLVTGVIVIVVNFLVDIIYAVVDPRVAVR